MPRSRRKVRTITGVSSAVAVLAGCFAAGMSAQAATRPATVTLAGSSVPFTSQVAPTGDLPGAQRLTVQLWLQPNLTAAEKFANAVSTPGNAQYRDYLSPDAYT